MLIKDIAFLLFLNILVFAARRPPTMVGRQRSSSRRGGGLLPAPLRMAGPPFLRDARVAGSPGRLGRDGGGGSGGGLRREGLQGAPVAAPFWATVFPGCGRRHLRRLDLLLAPLRDLVITGSGTTRGRHDWAGLRKEKLELRGEVGDALGSEHARYLKKSSIGAKPEAAQVPRRQLASSRTIGSPPAGLDLEPARPETAGEASRGLTLEPANLQTRWRTLGPE
jgi:hypothetical protein